MPLHECIYVFQVRIYFNVCVLGSMARPGGPLATTVTHDLVLQFDPNGTGVRGPVAVSTHFAMGIAGGDPGVRWEPVGCRGVSLPWYFIHTIMRLLWELAGASVVLLAKWFSQAVLLPKSHTQELRDFAGGHLLDSGAILRSISFGIDIITEVIASRIITRYSLQCAVMCVPRMYGYVNEHRGCGCIFACLGAHVRTLVKSFYLQIGQTLSPPPHPLSS